MAWQAIPNNPHWEYNDDPADPGVGSPLRPLWLKQSNGIRSYGTHQVYVDCRHLYSSATGELSKTYWDNFTPAPEYFITNDGFEFHTVDNEPLLVKGSI